MKIALFGAGGHVGHGILDEALRRGHDVVALVRDPARANIHDLKVTVVAANVADPASYHAALAGVDTAVAALSGRRDADSGLIPKYASILLDALPAAGVKRFVWVGGAGNLETAPGVTVSSSPQFPKDWLPEANAQAEALKIFRTLKADIDWTYISPAALLIDGERSGTYRVGGDRLLVDANGVSRITIADYAVAVLDCLEQNDHLRQRISVAY